MDTPDHQAEPAAVVRCNLLAIGLIPATALLVSSPDSFSYIFLYGHRPNFWIKLGMLLTYILVAAPRRMHNFPITTALVDMMIGCSGLTAWMLWVYAHDVPYWMGTLGLALHVLTLVSSWLIADQKIRVGRFLSAYVLFTRALLSPDVFRIQSHFYVSYAFLVLVICLLQMLRTWEAFSGSRYQEASTGFTSQHKPKM